jgi:hypothetical protein
MRLGRCLGVSALMLLGCGAARRDTDEPIASLPGLDAGEHLLLTPTGSPAELLGRAIEAGPNGELVIADERAPGCRVEVREIEAVWDREYDEDLGKIAIVAASIPAVVDLRAKYGTHIRARARIKNIKQLVGDFSGPCGEVVIKSVKVGRGSRELQYRREQGISTGAAVAGVGAHGELKDWKVIGSKLSWDRDQAWAFNIAKGARVENFRLSVAMPTELKDGDQYTLSVTATRQAHLVVLCEEADGRLSVLLPNADHPEVAVPAGDRRAVPAMRVSLRVADQPAREKIVVYAFSEREDFEDFRPPAGATSDDEALAYYKGLEQRLSALPRRRWTRQEISYLISPKQQP